MDNIIDFIKEHRVPLFITGVVIAMYQTALAISDNMGDGTVAIIGFYIAVAAYGGYAFAKRKHGLTAEDDAAYEAAASAAASPTNTPSHAYVSDEQPTIEFEPVKPETAKPAAKKAARKTAKPTEAQLKKQLKAAQDELEREREITRQMTDNLNPDMFMDDAS